MQFLHDGVHINVHVVLEKCANFWTTLYIMVGRKFGIFDPVWRYRMLEATSR